MNSKMKLNDIIGSEAYWQVNKYLAQNMGLTETILLQDLINKDAYFEKKGQLINGEWFFNTFENIERDTTLSRYMCQKPLKKLEQLGFLETKLMGIPAKKHFRINHEAVIFSFTNKAVFKKVENLNSKRLKRINKNKEKELNKENKISSTIKNNCASVSSFFNIELNEYQIEAVKLNGKLDILALCREFSNHMVNEYSIELCFNQTAHNDIKEHTRLKSGIVGLMFMYKNDFEKFEEIMKSVY